jgi:iron complex outermembrane receptor protein
MHAFKKAILLILYLFIATITFAQTPCKGIIKGKVKDESGTPLIGATVFIEDNQQGQVTDNLGNFSFQNLCDGKWKIKIQFLGYADLEKEVQVSEKEYLFTLKEVAMQLSEVVVQHHDDAQTEHATNYSLLSEKKLGELAGKSIGESLKEITGVNSIQTGPGIFKPVIHGVHSLRVLTLNHGLPQEGQQWGAEHAPEIDPFVASNLVVIKDASAIKYGEGALGGVIIVNPPALPENAGLRGTLSTILQSNGRSGTVSGMIEGGIKNHDGWGWRVQGTAKKGGDFNTPDYNLTNTGIQELNFSAATGYHKEKFGFDFFASRFQTEIGILKGTSISSMDDLIFAMESPVPQYTSDFSYAISEPRQEVSHHLLKLNGHLKTDRGEYRLLYGFQNNNRKEFDIRRGSLSKIPAIDLQLNTHTLTGEWETEHSEKRTFTAGINTTFQNNKNIPGTQRIPFIPNFTNTSAGAFIVTKLFMKQWTLDAGARYDFKHYDVEGYDFKNSFYSSSFSFHNASATVGATKTFAKEQRLQVSASTAWRAPHVAELYSLGTHQSAAAIEYGLLLNDTTNEVMDIRDVNFQAEKALKFVTTYQRSWNTLTVSVSPYINYIFNYTYLRPEGITKTLRGTYPYLRYTQTNALFTGIDAEAIWHITRQLKAIPKASLLRATDVTNDDYLVFIPSNRYELTLRYERAALASFKNFYVESKVLYVAEQKRAPRVITPRQIQEAGESGVDLFETDDSNFDFMAAPDGYVLWNMAAGVSIKSKKNQYDFRLASENLLNEVYREYTNRFRYYANEIGRNIMFSIKCIF